jgi:ADP-ribose pyrophosphatase YjhB (NUDIX family)
VGAPDEAEPAASDQLGIGAPHIRQALYHLADELRGVALLGLNYVKNEHDRARYERVLAAGAKIVSTIEARSDDDSSVLAAFQENLLHVSPVAGAEAVVVRDGKILLHRRADNGLWAMCGGLVEIGETLSDAATRELWEEACVRGRVTRLLAIFDSLRWDMRTKVQLYAALFEVESDDEPSPTPEATELGFFGPEELPPLDPRHLLRVPIVFKVLRGELPCPYFDPPQEPLSAGLPD